MFSTRYLTALARCAGLLCLLSAPFAIATELDTVIVTATRLEIPADEVPGNITVIDAKRIANSPAATLPELLSLEAGVFSRSLFGNHAASATLDVRGFGAASAENVLILLDGRRLNDVDQAAVDFAAIPLASIERIEIIRNGGGVLYGDGAVGGAINIVTRSAAGADEPGRVQLELGSYGTRELNASAYGNFAPFALRVDAHAVNSDGYRDNNDLQQRSLRADLRLSGADREWYLKAGMDAQDNRLPGERTVDAGIGLDELNDDRRGTNDPNDFANQDGNFATLGYTRVGADGGELVVDLGYRDKEQESFFDFGGGFSNYLETELRTLSFTPRLHLRPEFAGSAFDMRAGIDFQRSEYDAVQALTPATLSTPYGRIGIIQETAAVYANAGPMLNDATRLDIGARLQWVRTQGDDSADSAAPGSDGSSEAAAFDRSDRVHMVEFGLRRRLASRWSVFTRLARAARIATVDELFESKFDPGTFASARVFSPLDPQTSVGLDLGIDFTAGDVRANVTAYYMELKNEIHFDVASFDNVNLDPTRRQGVETSLQYPLGEWLNLRGSYTCARAEFRDGPYAGNELPLVPKNSASLSGEWRVRTHTLLAADVRHVGEKYFDNDQSNDFEHKIPAYTTLDVKLRHLHRGWLWQFAVRNLADERAFDYGVRSTFTPGRFNAYPLPERNFAFSVAKEF